MAEEFKGCIPVVSAIVEREHKGQVEILIQTRWKPKKDPKYSGTIEIPAGRIKRYEKVYDALQREVYEETGLKVLSVYPEIKTKIHSPQNDGSFAFQPFCCQQQIKGTILVRRRGEFRRFVVSEEFSLSSWG